MLVAYLWLFTWSDCVSDGLRLQCKRLAESGSGGFLCGTRFVTSMKISPLLNCTDES